MLGSPRGFLGRSKWPCRGLCLPDRTQRGRGIAASALTPLILGAEVSVSHLHRSLWPAQAFLCFAIIRLRPAGLRDLWCCPRSTHDSKDEGLVNGSPVRGLAAPDRRLMSDGATSPWAQPMCAGLSRHTPSGFSLNGTGNSLRQLLSSQPSLLQRLSRPLHRALWGARPPRLILLDPSRPPTPVRVGVSIGAALGQPSKELQHGRGGFVCAIRKGKR